MLKKIRAKLKERIELEPSISETNIKKLVDEKVGLEEEQASLQKRKETISDEQNASALAKFFRRGHYSKLADENVEIRY